MRLPCHLPYRLLRLTYIFNSLTYIFCRLSCATLTYMLDKLAHVFQNLAYMLQDLHTPPLLPLYDHSSSSSYPRAAGYYLYYSALDVALAILASSASKILLFPYAVNATARIWYHG